jgi:hypothetical protein
MPDDDALQARVQQVQAGLVERYGQNNTDAMIQAVSRQNVPHDLLRQIMFAPSAVEDFVRLSKESLLHELGTAERPSQVIDQENAYSELRAAEKKRWREKKGYR